MYLDGFDELKLTMSRRGFIGSGESTAVASGALVEFSLFPARPSAEPAPVRFSADLHFLRST
jgi:hypothetical protein